MSDGALTGKVAIVTGAGGGIGRAYARGPAEAVEVDVTDEDSVAAMARAAADRFGPVDILVDNAALTGHYGLTKLGIVSMTMSLAKELARDGIRVNAIAPGWVNTEAGMRTVPPEVRQALGASIPFPFGDPEDLVGGLVFLCSEASDWVTGHTLNVDGGWIPRT